MRGGEVDVGADDLPVVGGLVLALALAATRAAARPAAVYCGSIVMITRVRVIMTMDGNHPKVW
ncbi:hypothetical protein ACIA8K_03965 [Catenuloplanes sp. NPDC051500]|uniref:hypothetical protein n=1 Tax=Catenuloplanes sp. NPDC051500 TaxID=3363959 RepID=UPI0037A45E73